MDAFCTDIDPSLQYPMPLPGLFSEPDALDCEIPMILPEGYSCDLPVDRPESSSLEDTKDVEANLAGNAKLCPVMASYPVTPAMQNPPLTDACASEFGSLSSAMSYDGYPSAHDSKLEPLLEDFPEMQFKAIGFPEEGICENSVAEMDYQGPYNTISELLDTASESHSEITSDDEQSVVMGTKMPLHSFNDTWSGEPQSDMNPWDSFDSVGTGGPKRQPLTRLLLEFLNGASCEVTLPINNAELARQTGIQVMSKKCTAALEKHYAKVVQLRSQMRISKEKERHRKRLKEEERRRRALRRAILKSESLEGSSLDLSELGSPDRSADESPELENDIQHVNMLDYPITTTDACGTEKAKRAEALRLKQIANIDTLEYERIVLDRHPQERVVIIGTNVDRSIGGFVVDIPRDFATTTGEFWMPKSAEIKTAKRKETQERARSLEKLKAFHTGAKNILGRLVTDPNLWKQCMQEIRGGVRCRAKHCSKTFSCLAELALHYDVGESRCQGRGEFFCSHENCPWAVVGFAMHCELSRHMKATHFGECYICPSCGNEFTRKDSMKRHLAKCSKDLSPTDFASASGTDLTPENFLARTINFGSARALTTTVPLTDSLRLRHSRVGQLVLSMANINHEFLAARS